jgi:hypothetical protein
MAVRCLQCRQSQIGTAGPFDRSVAAAESAPVFQLTVDGVLDFTTPQANVVQLAIAKGFELKSSLALDAPIQIGHPPRLQLGDQLAGPSCDAL